MPRSPQPPCQLTRVLQAILVLIVCYYGYYCLKTQKSLGWDASMGLLTLQSSMEQGEFNRIKHPVPTALAKDQSEYIVWWTPGQYLVPHWLAKALHTDMGTALRVLSLLCGLIGLAGCYCLFTRLGFDRVVVVLSLIVISSQEAFLKASRLYSGGDLLLFAAAPFLSLGVLAAGATLYRRALIAALGCLLALFLKASALTFFSALMLYLVLELYAWPETRWSPQCGWNKFLRSLAVLAAIFLLFVGIIHVAYLSQGDTISASARPLDTFTMDRLWGVLVVVAGPLYGAFSFLEPYGRKAFLVPMALATLLLVLMLGRELSKDGFPAYRRLFFAHYLSFFGFFTYAYLVGMGISHEARHFKFLGLLFLPGLVHWLISRIHRARMAGAIVAWCLFAVVGYHLEINHHNIPEVSQSRLGVHQPVSNAGLEAMHRIDDKIVTPGTIVFNGFGACPSLLLEFNHGRRLQDDNWIYLGFQFTGRASTPVPWYRQTCDKIVLLISKNTRWYFGPSLAEIAKTFERTLHVIPAYEDNEMIIYVGSVK